MACTTASEWAGRLAKAPAAGVWHGHILSGRFANCLQVPDSTCADQSCMHMRGFPQCF